MKCSPVYLEMMCLIRRKSGVRAFAKQTSNLPGFTSGRLVRSQGTPPDAMRPVGSGRSRGATTSGKRQKGDAMSDLQKITEQQMDAVGVCSAPDMLTGSASENKAVFDKMVRQLIAPAYNAAVEVINTVSETETGIEAAEEERVSAEEKRASAEADRVSAEAARVQAEQERAAAEEQREDAERGYAARAERAARLSESWAAGGTGAREGEDTNNAKYWSDRAQAIVGTDYVVRTGDTMTGPLYLAGDPENPMEPVTKRYAERVLVSSAEIKRYNLGG